MHGIFGALHNIIIHNQLVSYVTVYIGTVFLGNIVSFTSLWIGLHDFFGEGTLLSIIGVLFLADVTADLMWYSLGRLARGTRIGDFIRTHIPKHEWIERHLHKNSDHWILFSKFIYSATFPVVFMVGWMGVPFKKFFRVSLLAITSSLALVTLITYALSSGISILAARKIVGRFELIFVASLLLFFILQWLIVKLGRRYLHEED